MIAVARPMPTQLFLFENEHETRARVRAPVDKEARRRRREARQRWAESIKLLPTIEQFITSGGESAYYVPTPERDPIAPPDEHRGETMTYADRYAEKVKLLAVREDREQRKRARKIFALADLLPEWIGDERLAEMDAEIERAKLELTSLWSANERRKRLKGLNASEKDPAEHWTPPFAAMSGGHHEHGDD